MLIGFLDFPTQLGGDGGRVRKDLLAAWATETPYAISFFWGCSAPAAASKELLAARGRRLGENHTGPVAFAAAAAAVAAIAAAHTPLAGT